MKRIIALVMALAICVSFAGCKKTMCSSKGCENEAVDDSTFDEPYCSKHLEDKKAFKASYDAYTNISTAYEIIEEFGSDIYEAWRMGIYDDDEILDDGAAHLATELSLTADEIRAGAVYTVYEDEWDTMSEKEKEEKMDYADLYFYLMEDNLFSFCVMVVSNAYIVNGKVAKAQTALDAAKAQMKELSADYSDYEHYPNLKGYFTTTSSFFEFCQDPTGSFEQVKDTINKYRNDARDFISDLNYIFED